MTLLTTNPAKEKKNVYILQFGISRAPYVMSSKPGGDCHIKERQCSTDLSGVRKAGLVPVRLFSLKKFTAGSFAVPFRVLN